MDLSHKICSYQNLFPVGASSVKSLRRWARVRGGSGFSVDKCPEEQILRVKRSIVTNLFGDNNAPDYKDYLSTKTTVG